MHGWVQCRVWDRGVQRVLRLALIQPVQSAENRKLLMVWRHLTGLVWPPWLAVKTACRDHQNLLAGFWGNTERLIDLFQCSLCSGAGRLFTHVFGLHKWGFI